MQAKVPRSVLLIHILLAALPKLSVWQVSQRVQERSFVSPSKFEILFDFIIAPLDPTLLNT